MSTLTAQQQARVRALSLRLRHIERQLAPFMQMSKDELEAMHPVFPVANWRLWVILIEVAGKTAVELSETLP